MAVSGKPIKVIILGAGTGGTALIDLFTRSSGVDILGVADLNPGAPGLKKARQLGIAVTHDVAGLLRSNGAGLIVDVTGDPALAPVLARYKAPGAEVLGGEAAKLLWSLVRHEAEVQSRLVQTEKLATIGTFSSGIAHDINNRLFLIMSLAENLLDGGEPELVRGHAGEILESVQRIRTMVEGLTGFARLSSPENAEEIEVNATLEEALKLARYATVFHDVAVLREYAAGPVVRANPQEMLQVFVNLISNAIQAMDGKGTLHIAVTGRDGTATVRISDTGPGIPEDLMEKIFDPFFTTKARGRGTGLGLHVVRTLAGKYGGKVSVHNREGRGATFCLELPTHRSVGPEGHGG